MENALAYHREAKKLSQNDFNSFASVTTRQIGIPST
jgi:hypothetical protein